MQRCSLATKAPQLFCWGLAMLAGQSRALALALVLEEEEEDDDKLPGNFQLPVRRVATLVWAVHISQRSRVWVFPPLFPAAESSWAHLLEAHSSGLSSPCPTLLRGPLAGLSLLTHPRRSLWFAIGTPGAAAPSASL